MRVFHVEHKRVSELKPDQPPARRKWTFALPLTVFAVSLGLTILSANLATSYYLRDPQTWHLDEEPVP